MVDERRQHPRVGADGACKILDEEGVERPFELVDLSESGVRFTCSAPIGAMTRIQVQMVLPGERVGHDEDVAFATMGVIVWNHRVADDRYDTGVFFPELAEDHAALLQAYVLSAV